ncbi:MAG: hypothetical protein WAT93_14160 [Pontixanthobacter sp.]
MAITSRLKNRIPVYLDDRYGGSTFTADIDHRSKIWDVNFCKPLSVAYGLAKKNLDMDISGGMSDQEYANRYSNKIDYYIGLATDIIFLGLAPFTKSAMDSMRGRLIIPKTKVVNYDIQYAVRKNFAEGSLTKKYYHTTTDISIKNSILNHVTDAAYIAIGEGTSSQISLPDALNKAMKLGNVTAANRAGNVLSPPGAIDMGSMPIPATLLTGEFSESKFQSDIKNIFDTYAVHLVNFYDIIKALLPSFLGPWLNYFSLNSVLVTPPPFTILYVASVEQWSAAIYDILASNYIISQQPPGWDQYHAYKFNIYIGRRINERLVSHGSPAIGDDGRTLPQGQTAAWSGNVHNLNLPVIMNLAKNGGSRLNALFDAVVQIGGVV